MRFDPRTGLALVLLAVARPAVADDPDPDVVVQEPDGDLEVKDTSEVDPGDRVLGPEHEFASRRRVVLVQGGDLVVQDAARLPRNDPRIVVYQDRAFRRWVDGRWVTWNGVHPGLQVTTTTPLTVRPAMPQQPFPVVQSPRPRQIPLDPDEDPNDGLLLDTDGDGLFG